MDTSAFLGRTAIFVTLTLTLESFDSFVILNNKI